MRLSPELWIRSLVWTVGILALLYVLIAYVILPAVWSHYEHQPGLATVPMLTRTKQGIPGDPLNVGLVGSKDEIIRAMSAAGWNAADAITRESSIRIGLSVIFNRPYPDAPVSSLFYEGRKQDLAFEQDVGRSADRRNHVRYWLVLSRGAEGREVWLGSASFDIGVGLSHDTGQITHHVDPDLDAERNHLIAALSNVGALSTTYQVSGVGPTLTGRNGGGDPYFTDGEITLGVIDPKLDFRSAPGRESLPTALPNPPAIIVKHRLWQTVIDVARFLHFIPEPAKTQSASVPDR